MSHEFKIFDSHLHIIDEAFPLVSNNGFIPEPFTVENYRERLSDFNIIGGTIVSGSFQAYDQKYLISALDKLGSNYKGILNLSYRANDEEIINLNQLGVAGVRFNLYREGSESIKYLEAMAKRIFNIVGWHVELYLNSEHLSELSPMIEKLPAVSIDHLGLKKSGFKHLLKLVEKGVKVKASGFGRIDFDPAQAIKEIYNAHPDSLMFGTDLPSTRAPIAFQNSDISLIADTLEANAAKKVFSENAIKFYNIKTR